MAQVNFCPAHRDRFRVSTRLRAFPRTKTRRLYLDLPECAGTLLVSTHRLAGYTDGNESPRAAVGARARRVRLILRAPDQRVHVRVGVAGGAAEIGVERFGPELRGGDRERDVVPTRSLAATNPAGADLDALRNDPV